MQAEFISQPGKSMIVDNCQYDHQDLPSQASANLHFYRFIPREEGPRDFYNCATEKLNHAEIILA